MDKMPIQFMTVFDNPEKICKCNWEVKINSIIDLGEMIEVSVEDKNNVKFNGLIIMKGEIFPLPKKEQNIIIDKIKYGYDKNFKKRFFINANIINPEKFDNKNVIKIPIEDAILKIDKYIEEAKKLKENLKNESEKKNIQIDNNENKEYKNNFEKKSDDENKSEKDTLNIGTNKTNESDKDTSTKVNNEISNYENENRDNEECKIEKPQKIIEDNKNLDKNIIESEINQIYELDYDFSTNLIIPSLKNCLEIKKELLTNLFIVESVDEYYTLKSLENNELFLLMKQYMGNFNLNKNDILIIDDYYLVNTKIEPTKLTLIEKLTDENLFFILQEYKEIGKKYLWGKIINIDNEILTLMDNKMNIIKIKNNKEKVKLGQFFLFAKYKIINKETNEIIFDKNYFNYFSGQDIYFSKKIELNKYSVIQFYFKDFKKDNNKYNLIEINNEQKKIDSDKLYFVIERKKIKNYEIYLQDIVLSHEEIDYNSKRFTVTILQGFLKKITTFINYDNNNSFYYEILYYSFNDFNFLKNKIININDLDEIISIYDDLGSINRRQFNILNVPFQKNFIQNKNIIGNSFLICETFFDNPNMPELYGFFNLKEILTIYPFQLLDNNIYDKYYDEFGNIIDYLSKNNISSEDKAKFIDECIIKLSNYFNILQIFDFLSNVKYDENISLSQFKTRLGIISSYYLYLTKKNKEDTTENTLELMAIYNSIMKNNEFLSLNQMLRIFILLTRRRFEFNQRSKLLILKPEDSKYSAYYEAQEFNIKEIKNINEYSRLFSGYLQMDSYILHNYLSNDDSYSFSIEPLFILQKHLESNYEGFLILEKQNNNIIAWTEPDVQITIINEYNLFQRTDIKNISVIKDEKIRKNHAFGISIVLRHEKNSHQKKNMKNKYLNSPIYYCDNGKRKRYIYQKYKEKNFGEDGIIIESFITEDRNKIISLAKDFIYGELMKYELFIDKDFNSLNENINIIREKNKVYFKEYPFNNLEYEHPQNDTMAEFKDQKCENIGKEEIMNILKHGQVNIGCQFYTLNMIKDMIIIAKKRGKYESLPTIIKKIYEELKTDN
jgi:hypothetical protein